MNITVENQQKRIPLKPQIILLAAKKILRHEKVKTVDLSIVFVLDSKIKSLNKKYLQENHPTDVLSFDFKSVTRGNHDRRVLRQILNYRLKNQNLLSTSGEPTNKLKLVEPRVTSNESRINGEIIISADTAVRNARAYQTSPQQEILLYVIHGILHLLGYDDHSPDDIQEMRRKEAELMSVLKR